MPLFRYEALDAGGKRTNGSTHDGHPTPVFPLGAVASSHSFAFPGVG